MNNEYTREMDLEKENKLLRDEIKMIKENMNKQFTEIMYMIQQSPQLAYIKPEALNSKAHDTIIK